MKKNILLVTALLVALIVAAIPVVSMGATGEATICAAPGQAGSAGGDFATVLDDYVSNGTNFIKLNADVTVDVTIDKTVYLDLNGNDVAGKITINGGALYVMDTVTDAYTNATYGKITATLIGGELQAVEVGSGVSAVEPREDGYSEYRAGYLKVTETDGVSFHRVDLALTNVTFNPAQLGISYISPFSGDDAVANVVQEYGVVLSIKNNQPVPGKANCGASTFSNFEAGVGVNEGTGTKLVNIMREKNTNRTNEANANTPIYARAYIKTADGYLYGAMPQQEQTLKGVVEKTDVYVGDAGETLKKNSIAMYEKFKSVMSKWNVENLDKAYEDDTIKILMIGNSHGVDATKQLNEVFKAAAPGKKVIIGALYHSGCRIDQHMSYIANAEGNYIYYKIDNTKSTWSRFPAHKKDPVTGKLITGEQDNGNVLGGVSLNYGLLDEKWDFITLQQMSTYAAYDEGEYNFNQLDDLIDYVRTNATGTPKLYWFDTWAHPNDDTRVATYSGTGYGSRWYNQHVELFGLSQHTMYNMLIANVKDTILPRVESGKLDGVIDSATAVLYMEDVMGLSEYQIFRDGTHVSDFGRLMVASMWYSTFTGDTLTVDKLPDKFVEITAGYPGNTTVTDTMKQQIVEVLTYAMNPDNKFNLPAGAVESERIIFADEMDGFWVCNGVTADLKNAKSVAGVVVEKVDTAKDNTVTITLEGFGDIVLSRVDNNTMKVTSIPAALAAASGINADSVFTFQAN